MKRWPPREPERKSAIRATRRLIVEAKELLVTELREKNDRLQKALREETRKRVMIRLIKDQLGTSQELKMAQGINLTNTSMALCEADWDEWDGDDEQRPLVVSLETTRNDGVLSEWQRLKASGMHVVLPMDVTHGAINAMPKRLVVPLANQLDFDFRTFLLEQREFAETAGAPQEEIDAMSLDAFGDRLQTIYQQIRDRALPLTYVQE